MKVVIFGNGNVAALWVKWLTEKDIHILQIVGRNENKIQQFAVKHNITASVITDLKELILDADLYIIAVPDNEIAALANSLQLSPKVVIHCAGSQPIELLKRASSNIGVLWPIYSISQENLPNIEENIPFIIDASNDYSLDFLQKFIQKFTENYSVANDDARKWMHLSAVISNNFTNYLGSMVQQIGIEQNIPINYLNSIWIKTVENILSGSNLSNLQTGPAQRNDTITLQNQIDLLKEKPDWQAIYKSISNAIQKSKK